MESNNLLAQNAIQLSSSTTLIHTQPVLKAKSCIACRKRKVRCDRAVPCSNCARWSVDCVYPSPVRTCARPRKRPTSQAAATQGFPRLEDHSYYNRISVLEGRISQLTAALDMQNGQLRTVGQRHNQIQAARHTWSQAMAHCFPPAHTAQACWRVFLETVDPLVKILYRPHAYQVLQRVTQAPQAGRDGEHALVLAIYLACICAMEESAVQMHFQMTKANGIATFRSATERALLQAGFTTTDDMTTIQALVLFISFSIYQREQKSAWTLTGLARRLDYAPGKGRSLFDTEMWRRLWWQLWYLDHRATEDYRGKESGSEPDLNPAQGGMALPLNCCDTELHPNMTRLPPTQSGWTEMSFSLIRFDIAYTRRTIESDQPWTRKIEAVQSCQRRLQTRYLVHCDGSQPIHWLAQHVAYVLTTEIWMNLYNDTFAISNPHTSADRLVCDKLFIAAIDILDIPVRLEKEPQAKNWEWLLGAYFQFTPLTFLLKELVRRYDDPLAQAGWHVAQRAFQRWPQVCLHNQRQCVYRPSRRGGARRGAKYESAKKQQQERQSDNGGIHIHHLSPGLVVDSDAATGPLDGIVGASCPATPQTRRVAPIALRTYETEKDLLNAYYIYIHPYLPLLPPPPFPQTEDRPLEIFPRSDRPDWSVLSVHHRSPLALALSALLVLIPPAGDLTPLSEPATSLRASYSQLYVRAADDLLLAHARPPEPTFASLFASPSSSSSWSPLHPHVSADLDCVLAMLALAVYEYCHSGNRKQMRARAYQALTAAMDLSLHSFGADWPGLSDAHKRTWWMTMYLVTQSAIFNHAEPIMLKDDPRICMPYPEFRGCREPWPLLMDAQDALRRAGVLTRKLAQTTRTRAVLPTTVADDIRRLDIDLVALGSQLDKSRCVTNQEAAEASAARNLWVTGIQLVHTSRIKLHRFIAFADKPLFLDKHCDLATLGLDDLAGSPASPASNEGLNTAANDAGLPFAPQTSARVCLKSALAICRIFRSMPAPNPRFAEVPSTASDANSAVPLRGAHPRSLPYLACAAMQSCYVLLMVVRDVRAGVALGDLSACASLLDSPEPGTEVQEAERLVEEIRNGIASLRASLTADSVFAGVLNMAREVDATYLAYFQDLFP